MSILPAMFTLSYPEVSSVESINENIPTFLSSATEKSPSKLFVRSHRNHYLLGTLELPLLIEVPM